MFLQLAIEVAPAQDAAQLAVGVVYLGVWLGLHGHYESSPPGSMAMLVGLQQPVKPAGLRPSKRPTCPSSLPSSE